MYAEMEDMESHPGRTAYVGSIWGRSSPHVFYGFA